MLPCLTTPEGVIYVTGTAPAADAPSLGGVCFSPEGALHISPNAPLRFQNGIAMAGTSRSVAADVGAIAGYVGGLPVTATGALKVQLNQTPAPLIRL